MSAAQQVADDLLAEAINQPPTTRCLRRGSWVAVVADGALAEDLHGHSYVAVPKDLRGDSRMHVQGDQAARRRCAGCHGPGYSGFPLSGSGW